MTDPVVPEADPIDFMQAFQFAVEAGWIDPSQWGTFIPEDQEFSGLIPQGYSLEFLYPWEIETGDFEWDWDPEADPLPLSGKDYGPTGIGGIVGEVAGLLLDVGSPGPGVEGAMETDIPIMRNYSLRDELGRYIGIEAGSAEQEALADILWSNNFYTSGVTETEKLSPRNIDSAFKFAVGWGARQGVSVWDMGEGPGRTAAPTLTEATIFYTADKAAQEAFGRNASKEEKQMALTISRALEASGISPSKADIQAELTAGSPDEVDQRAMSSTLRHLMKAIATRGTR